MPASLTLTSTLNLRCPPGDIPVTLAGAPTKITCQTGSTPCIVIGSTGANNTSRQNLSLKDVVLTGPGATIAGSEAVQILPSGGYSKISGLRVNYFETGLHLIGDANLLSVLYLDQITIGAPGATTSTAVHLDGHIANAYFTNFTLSGINRVILDDGPGVSGAGASFTDGVFNTTTVEGTAAVSVSSSDGNQHQLTLTNIQDWETACPYLEIGDQSSVIINGVAWTGNPWGATTSAGIHILNGSAAWLKINNATLNYCTVNGDILKVDGPNAFVTVSSSDFYLGNINFVGASAGTFVGNRCVSSNATAMIGNLTNVRSSANISKCPDR